MEPYGAKPDSGQLGAPGDWPANPWRLTAAESYQLRYQGAGHGIDTFKFAVAELVARAALRMDRVELRGHFGRTKQWSCLTDGRRVDAEHAPVLEEVLDLYLALPRREVTTLKDGHSLRGVIVEDLAQAAVRHFRKRRLDPPRSAFDRYRDEWIMPSLVERGLLEAKKRRRFSYTEEGRRLDADLERWIDLGAKELPKWALREPSRALAYTGAAGTSILLADAMFPQLELLARRYHADALAAGSGGGGGGEAGFGADALDFGGLDFGGLDFGGLDFGGLDFSGFAGGGGDGGGGGGG